MTTEDTFNASEVRRARYTIYVNAACCAGWAVLNAAGAWWLERPRLLGLSGAALGMIASWAIALHDLSAGRVLRGVLNYVASGLVLLLVMGLFVPELALLFTFATFIFLAFGISYAGPVASARIVALTLAIAFTLLFTSQVLGMSSGIAPQLLRWVNVIGMGMALGINATSFIGLRKTLEARGQRIARAEQRFRLLLENAPDPIGVLSPDGVILEANRGWEAMLGVPRAQFLGHRVEEFTAKDLPAAAVGPDQPLAPLTAIRRPDGRVSYFELDHTSVEAEGERFILGIGRDVTERLRLEAQLRQAQKMEAIGRLAGGIAHDFNNILSVISIHSGFLLADLKPPDPLREQADEIAKAAGRATDLTRQLLMFSRQQVIEPKVLDLNEVLAGMNKMLARILGEDVELVTVRSERLGHVRIDPSSFEQVIMNLVVNARDAMPTGGKLTIETANVTLDGPYAATHVGASSGPHVMIAVADTGVGIDKTTQTRIFEPFFTTKERTKGTGLGLATVLGIVQQSGGSIFVYSEPGRGATFKVYLPRVEEAIDQPHANGSAKSAGGSETVLVVDDDAPVRAATCDLLRRLGYQVVEAHDATEALQLGERHPAAIALLLTDVVMPQMSGPELAKRIAPLRPSMKVICMSGYTDDSIVRHGVLQSQIAYLQKPITLATLSKKVREVLDTP